MLLTQINLYVYFKHIKKKQKSKTWFHVHCAKHHQHSSHLSPYLTKKTSFPPFFQHISHQECETKTKLLASSLSFPPLLAHCTSTQNPHNFYFEDIHIKHFTSLPLTNSKRWQGFKEKPQWGRWAIITSKWYGFNHSN